MADDNGRNSFSDFDVSEIFTDFKTHSGNDERKSVNKQKFVVHIDDSLDDSFDYDFGAFSSAADREKEEKRRQESRRSFEQFDDIINSETENRRRSAPPVRTPVKRGNVTEPTRQPEGEYLARGDKALGERTAARRPVPAPQRKPRNAAPNTQVPQNVAEASANAPSRNIRPAPESQPAQNVKQSDGKQVVRLRTRSKLGILTGFTGLIALTLIFTLILSTIGLSTIGDIVAYNRDATSVSVVIENEKNGDPPTMEHVIDALHSAGLIKQKYLCILFAKFRHFDGYTNRDKVWVPTEYLSGVYYLEPELGLEGMLNTIKKSTSTGADVITLTFPEGWTISQIFERLEKNGVCDQSKLYANIEAVAKQYDFYYNINQSGLRYLGVEGYLFPDTYEFYKNENAVSVLKKLFDNSDVKWKKSYAKRAKELGYTRDEILMIASIIQREAANSSQMANVSSVIHNRMNSSTYLKLQCNSTLDYVTNSVKGHVDKNMVEIYSNAYNTYRVEGLPPGPICNPGIDAIEAALYPAETNYYFFVHNKYGKIYLSETFAQFQKDWAQVTIDNAS